MYRARLPPRHRPQGGRYDRAPSGQAAGADVAPRPSRRCALVAPGVKILATPSSSSSGMSPSGMIPPPKTTMSPASRSAQLLEHGGEERHVGAGEHRQADGVGVLLDRGLDDLLRRLVQAGVDDLDAGVAQRARHDLGAAVVPVEAGLGHDHADRARRTRCAGRRRSCSWRSSSGAPSGPRAYAARVPASRAGTCRDARPTDGRAAQGLPSEPCLPTRPTRRRAAGTARARRSCRRRRPALRRTTARRALRVALAACGASRSRLPGGRRTSRCGRSALLRERTDDVLQRTRVHDAPPVHRGAARRRRRGRGDADHPGARHRRQPLDLHPAAPRPAPPRVRPRRHRQLLARSTATCGCSRDRLGELVEEVCEETGYERIHVVGHSPRRPRRPLLRAAPRRRRARAHARDPRQPHAGTLPAYVLPHPLVRQLRPGSDVVTRARRAGAGLPHPVRRVVERPRPDDRPAALRPRRPPRPVGPQRLRPRRGPHVAAGRRPRRPRDLHDPRPPRPRGAHRSPPA